MTGEEIKWVRDEIKKQVNIILAGLAGVNTNSTEDINSQYPGSPVVPARPVMHPYGFVSRSSTGTMQVVARVGDHPGNRMVLGHRDANRPSDVQPGEAYLYSSGGYQIRVKNNQIQLGKNGTWETAVLGDTLQTILVSFLNIYLEHTHEGNLGFPTGVPSNESDAQDLLTNKVQKGTFLADDGEGE
jgi:phage gp45-like